MIVFIVNPILIIAAVLPAVALMIYIYRSDRLESESPRLILYLLLQGIVATSLAAFTESIGAHILGWFLEEDTILYNAIFFFLIVALSEEGFKYLLLKDRTWNSRAFNCQFDGVVYAVSVSLGFALWENIQYVILYGFEDDISTAILGAMNPEQITENLKALDVSKKMTKEILEATSSAPARSRSATSMKRRSAAWPSAPTAAPRTTTSRCSTK